MTDIDPQAITTLETAVAADPANLPLRLHLVSLLLHTDAAPRALEHCQAALVAEPANHDLLRLAAASARATGNDALASAYEQLGTTTVAVTGSAPAPERAQARAVAENGDAAFDAELDALLVNAAEDAVEVETPRMTLADVGGMEPVKRQIERSFLAPMRNPELRRMYGKSLRGGLLLYGPPGCGKTFLARAVAGELGANFFALGLHEVLDMWLGQSEQNLHQAFERARRNAPCVLFLDEVDALGQKRSNLTKSAGRNVVVQLLTELDSLGAENEGLFILAATNQPWDVDPALRRPGRFDRTVLVLPPDTAARDKILEYHLRGRPVDTVDLRQLAQRTDGFSGADIRLVCESAAELAIEDSLQTGRARPISGADLARAISATTPSTGSWFDVARNFVTFANQSSEYDDLYSYMKQRRML